MAESPVTTDLIIFQRQSNSVPADPRVQYPCDILCPGPVSHLCNRVRITVTDQGKKATNWDIGRTWGIRIYERSYLGTLFTLYLIIMAPILPGGQSPHDTGPRKTLALPVPSFLPNKALDSPWSTQFPYQVTVSLDTPHLSTAFPTPGL